MGWGASDEASSPPVLQMEPPGSAVTKPRIHARPVDSSPVYLAGGVPLALAIAGMPGALQYPAAAQLRLPRLLLPDSGTILAHSLLLSLAVAVMPQ
ncbi:hypothetical protein NDU88_008675 [Pleurodeles waltl]|uniref:Uncharacterized protein n=1 Tax=Pleurodeles waltl TaxID=8319 RepID=A0AAV7RWS9_PLEWA|nr:hypothetical protein NDU88_008675 [Pleurodeles waltl]